MKFLFFNMKKYVCHLTYNQDQKEKVSNDVDKIQIYESILVIFFLTYVSTWNQKTLESEKIKFPSNEVNKIQICDIF